MKRSVAAALGVVLVGGLGVGLYVATRGSSSPSPATGSSDSPVHGDHNRAVADSPETRSPDPAALGATAQGAASQPPTHASASPPAAASSVTNDLAGSGEAPARHGQDQIKLERPATPGVDETSSADERAVKERAVQQKSLNQRFEAAACRAPGIAERMQAMSDADREKLRTTCARAGVRLP